MEKTRVLILGGGFGGLYAALEFEKLRNPDFEVTLISQENFFLFTPMLHEVAASDLDVTHIVNPIRKMLRHIRFFEGEVRSVHLAERRVVVAHGFDRHTHSLEYDHIVFGLGCVINFYNIPGLRDRAVPLKSLGDATAAGRTGGLQFLPAKLQWLSFYKKRSPSQRSQLAAVRKSWLC
jgi:NADH dehydrogenase